MGGRPCIARDGRGSSAPGTLALAPRAQLRLALEGSLPEELALAQVVTDPAREHEEQVGEAVQVGERPLADVLAPHEAKHVPLRAPAHGARDVEERAHAPAAREHEGLERLQDRKSTRLNSSHRCISYAVF